MRRCTSHLRRRLFGNIVLREWPGFGNISREGMRDLASRNTGRYNSRVAFATMAHWKEEPCCRAFTGWGTLACASMT